jgi:AcrR family transcriptional regulator
MAMAQSERVYISRRKVAEKALALVDEVGVDALNIRRLGAELGVNGASLYYHYRSKDDILEAVARHVLRGLELPDTESDDWRGWLVQCNLSYRDTLMRHPNVVPILLRGSPGRYRPDVVIEYLTAAFVREGYSPDDIVWILEVLESFTIGLVLVANTETTDGQDRGPARNQAVFVAICRGLIEQMITVASITEPRRARSPAARARRVATAHGPGPAASRTGRATKAG